MVRVQFETRCFPKKACELKFIVVQGPRPRALLDLEVGIYGVTAFNGCHNRLRLSGFLDLEDHVNNGLDTN